MKKLAKVEVILPERKRPGRPKKIFDHSKLDSIVEVLPESPVELLENLLIFDARCLDMETRQELLRILPQLVHIRRAWKAEYMECGCISCHKKRVDYASAYVPSTQMIPSAFTTVISAPDSMSDIGTKRCRNKI